MGQANPDAPTAAGAARLKSELPIDLQRIWTQRNFERSHTYHESRWSAEVLIVNWLFVLNTGSFAGGVSLVSSRGLSDNLHFSLICSGLGVFCLLLRAAWAYYRAEFKLYGALRKDIAAFDGDEMTTVEFLDRDRARTKGSHLLHLLAWTAGLLLLASIGFGYWAIREPPAAPKSSSSLEYSRCVGVALFDFEGV